MRSHWTEKQSYPVQFGRVPGSRAEPAEDRVQDLAAIPILIVIAC